VQTSSAEAYNPGALEGQWAGSSRFSPANEAALVARTKAGSATAFSDLMKHCERSVFQVLLRMTRNQEDAEDARQEAMLKAFLHLDRFEGRSRFSTWVTRIAMNEALMKLRSRRSGKQVSLDEMVDAGDSEVLVRKVSKTNEHPDQIYARRELQETLAEAIADLQPQSQRVFVLRALEQRSTSETAKALKVSPTAVKSRFRRARLQLRQRLADRAKNLA
jgi:RNA polymerase sigma-70 factor (ECF subfamily)